jgi:endonuclease YncB( thermonuclease family)
MIRAAILALALAGIVPAVLAGQRIPASKPVVIVDGDTVDIDGVRIRLLGIDAPETFRSRCENELVLGLKAKARLRQLLDSGQVSYEPHGHDRYGRTLAHVLAGGIDVGQVLLAEGLALRYEPGFEAKQQRLRAWCG